jgi:hypothetical protein
MYILDKNNKPVPEPDIYKWGRWMRETERHVAKEDIGDVTVSTVFLGIDHSFGRGAPVLWETMAFGGPKEIDQDQMRCRGSWEQAEAMHVKMVERVKAALKRDQ